MENLSNQHKKVDNMKEVQTVRVTLELSDVMAIIDNAREMCQRFNTDNSYDKRMMAYYARKAYRFEKIAAKIHIPF